MLASPKNMISITCYKSLKLKLEKKIKDYVIGIIMNRRNRRGMGKG
jgi:hypothetical protein